MEGKFAPGPYKVMQPHYDKGFQVAQVIGGEPRLILATMVGGDQEAQAQLFAQAPELLEALDNVTAALETTLTYYGIRMPVSDRKTRRKLIDRARELTDIWRRGEEDED